MELKKFGASEVMHVIRHNLRYLRSGQSYGNENIDSSLSWQNYDLVHRGNTPEEVNSYRKNLEKEIFAYKRKNLIHAVSVVIQLPQDCPPEQEEAFFKECYTFWCNQLPMGERSIFQAQVHKDEIVTDRNGNRISNDHLHLMYVPAVPDAKHDGYDFKLCADQLTKRSVLKNLHPALQKHLDEVGINATVYRKSKDDGQTIKLSVAQLKEFTRLTGGSISRTITVEDLANLFKISYESDYKIQEFARELAQKNRKLDELLMQKESEEELYKKELSSLQEKLNTTSAELDAAKKENQELIEELDQKAEKRRTFSFRSSTAEKQEERSFTF